MPRDQLAKHEQFATVSPSVGVLDEAAFEQALDDDPDKALTLLVDMGKATDPELRATARALAARILLDQARRGMPRKAGTRRLRHIRADQGGDLDLDASLGAIAGARAEGRPPGLDELVARDWGQPETALCLVIDTSGSMSGERLAAAALTAAACAWRAPGDHAVLSFSREVTVLRPMESSRPASAVVDSVLELRGHGVTALATALRAAGSQLALTRAARKVVVLLSDCRVTDEQDPVPAASALPELLILPPAEDTADAEALALASGARWAGLPGASAAPQVLGQLLR